MLMGRSDVTFVVDGTRCSGWWYPAADGGDDADASSDDRRRPCVVMAHGLAAVKEMRLDAYAERFAAAGMSVFVFDYRGFGSSDGEPRQLLDIDAQHADWEAAVAYARTRPSVDGTRIVLWGSSLSGGHVLHLAQRVNAAGVIAQVPHTDAIASARSTGLAASARLGIHALYDAGREALGRSPHYVPATGRPGELAIMSSPEATEYLDLVPEGFDFDQRVAARFGLRLAGYSPGRALAHLTVPVLMQVGTRDQTTPPAAAIKAAGAGRHVTLKVHDVGHFEPYTGEAFEVFVGEQIEFLRSTVLEGPGVPPRTMVITGAGAGIGLAAARLLAGRGWVLCLTDVDDEALAAQRAELGDRHSYEHMDVADAERVGAVMATFASAHGGSFDALLNNAGLLSMADFESLPLARHRTITRVNVDGVLTCTHLAFPYLKGGTDPQVINMCSASADYGVPQLASYSASKFWVKGFTEAINIEWEQHGIHVCDIAPGFVGTGMLDGADGDIVDAVGVNLGAQDVANAIVSATEDRTRVHWVVDRPGSRLQRAIINRAPTRLHRLALKRYSGY